MTMETASEFRSLVTELINQGPKSVDLTQEEVLEQIFITAERILEYGVSIETIDTTESDLIDKNDESLIFILLVLKIVRSRLLVNRFDRPLKVSVVFAVYKENNRIRKQSEHPHGENFLVKKVEQLKWLFGEMPEIQWKLIVVDDGCPEGSGRIAEEISEKEGLNEYVKVLFLEKAIVAGLEPARALSSTSESQKGGSIVYGMWDAVQNWGTDDHMVAFTDADLSTHLGQLGLLLNPLYQDAKLSAIGSRRETDSVVIKTGSRNVRGKLFIYLWKRLISNLGDIIDTQCGFKAFQAGIIPEITNNLIEKKFAFDIELLLRTSLIDENGIAKIGVAWIDSEAASTTTEIRPYLPMLKSIVKMYRKYLPENEESEEYAKFIEELSEENFSDLLERIPQEIQIREPLEFTEYNEVKAPDLKASIDL